MEKDPEWNQEVYTTEYRMYDSRLGKWFSVDPAFMKYPEYSPYHFSGNNPLIYTDPQGDDWYKDDEGNTQWMDSNADEYKVNIGGEGEEVWKVWQNIGDEMLEFNGETFTYYYQTEEKDDEGNTHYKLNSMQYNAVSGYPIIEDQTSNATKSIYTFDYSQERQKLPNLGPIPEGLYSIQKSGLQVFGGEPWLKQKVAPFGFGTWPGGEGSWGRHRWFPKPEQGDQYGRSGYAIHGGYVWGSRGCIDLGCGMTQFTRDFMSRIGKTDKVYLKVDYTIPKIRVQSFANTWFKFE